MVIYATQPQDLTSLPCQENLPIDLPKSIAKPSLISIIHTIISPFAAAIWAVMYWSMRLFLVRSVAQFFAYCGGSTLVIVPIVNIIKSVFAWFTNLTVFCFNFISTRVTYFFNALYGAALWITHLFTNAVDRPNPIGPNPPAIDIRANNNNDRVDNAYQNMPQGPALDNDEPLPGLAPVENLGYFIGTYENLEIYKTNINDLIVVAPDGQNQYIQNMSYDEFITLMTNLAAQQNHPFAHEHPVQQIDNNNYQLVPRVHNKQDLFANNPDLVPEPAIEQDLFANNPDLVPEPAIDQVVLANNPDLVTEPAINNLAINYAQVAINPLAPFVRFLNFAQLSLTYTGLELQLSTHRFPFVVRVCSP